MKCSIFIVLCSGWCNYAFPPTFTPNQTISCSSKDNNDVIIAAEAAEEGAIVASILSFLILCVVCYAFFLHRK